MLYTFKMGVQQFPNLCADLVTLQPPQCQLSHSVLNQVLSNFEDDMVVGLRSKRQLDTSPAAKLTEAVAKVTTNQCTINKAAKEAGIDRRPLKRLAILSLPVLQNLSLIWSSSSGRSMKSRTDLRQRKKRGGEVSSQLTS